MLRPKQVDPASSEIWEAAVLSGEFVKDDRELARHVGRVDAMTIAHLRDLPSSCARFESRTRKKHQADRINQRNQSVALWCGVARRNWRRRKACVRSL